MVCVTCLAAPVLLFTGVSSMYYNVLIGLIITIIFFAAVASFFCVVGDEVTELAVQFVKMAKIAKMVMIFIMIRWWLGAESNCPPMGYESIALTN